MNKILFALCVWLGVAAPARAQEAFDRPYWLDRSVIEAIGRANTYAAADNAAFSVTFSEVADDARSALFAASD